MGVTKTCLVIKIRNGKRLMTPNHAYPLKFMSAKQKIHVSCKKLYKQTRKQEKMTSYRGNENGSQDRREGGKEEGRE